MEVLYEDNHIIIVNKSPGEIVQGDKSGDTPLVDLVRDWLKKKYDKPGNVFCGVVHRLDRPVGGIVVFAKTSKALARMNELFRLGRVRKRYWAVTRNLPPKQEDELTHYITASQTANKSYASPVPVPGAKEARLAYRHIASSENYHLIEVELFTGRKHQIRAQLSAVGAPIKGDLKYGDKRSNPDGGICLIARHIEFVHPVSRRKVEVTAPVPDDPLWRALAESALKQTVVIR